MGAHILIVDDRRDIRDPLAQYLTRNGLRVSKAESAAKARQKLATYSIDLVLLDVMMPGEDGFAFCAFLRATTEIPVILVTAKVEEADRVVGLELGADDYVTKPFSPRELLARIKAVLRRVREGGSDRGPGPDAQAFAFDRWILKVGDRELVDHQGVALPLSTGEFVLLLAFVKRSGRVLTRDQLLDLTRRRQLVAYDRSVDIQISRLRSKIERDPKNPALIKTVWGRGYTFAANVAIL